MKVATYFLVTKTDLLHRWVTYSDIVNVTYNRTYYKRCTAYYCKTDNSWCFCFCFCFLSSRIYKSSLTCRFYFTQNDVQLRHDLKYNRAKYERSVLIFLFLLRELLQCVLTVVLTALFKIKLFFFINNYRYEDFFKEYVIIPFN